jgi:hypothetical protein
MAFAVENCTFAFSLPRLNPFISPNGAHVKKGFRLEEIIGKFAFLISFV